MISFDEAVGLTFKERNSLLKKEFGANWRALPVMVQSPDGKTINFASIAGAADARRRRLLKAEFGQFASSGELFLVAKSGNKAEILNVPRLPTQSPRTTGHAGRPTRAGIETTAASTKALQIINAARRTRGEQPFAELPVTTRSSASSVVATAADIVKASRKSRGEMPDHPSPDGLAARIVAAARKARGE